VHVDEAGRVRAFLEKDGVAQGGLVNAGLYLTAADALAAIPTTGAYSIEKEWLPALVQQPRAIYGHIVAQVFTDIGTPADYWRLANQQVK
jgi:NDP-sugar pyrophosphorylase family protein